MRAEVAGKKVNSTEEVLERLVDYGPLSMSLVLLATAVVLLPYPSMVRWGFALGVGLFLLACQYLVSTDLRPTVHEHSISARWFLMGVVAGAVGFYAPLTMAQSWGPVSLAHFGLLVWAPVQVGIGLVLFLAAQGIRQRHSLLISAIGITTTLTVVALLHVVMSRNVLAMF